MLTNIAQRILQSAAAVTSRGSEQHGPRILTLIYHRVLEKPDFMRPNEILREKFEWQMELLARFFRVYPLTEALKLQHQGELPARSVAITFDDGYADNYHTALPVLNKFGLPATFFVASGFLDGGRMWNDSVIEAVRVIPGNTLDLSAEGMGVYDLSSREFRAATADSVVSKIKHKSAPERARLTELLVAKSSTELPINLMMTSEELRRLAGSGMEIGGHTISHPILAKLSEEDSRREIVDGKRALESIVDAGVTLFAYPNGRFEADYQQKDVAIVRQCGFSAAVTTHLGVSQRSTDCFQLPRFTPWNPTPVGFMAQMASMYRNVL